MPPGPRALRRLALAGLAAAALACAGPAAAAFQPRPVVDLFTGELVNGVQVAASPQGDAVVGWTGQNNQPTVLAAFRPGDGPFAPVEILSTKANGFNPDFAFEPDGTVLALWSHATVGEMGGWARRPRAGAFSPAQSLGVVEHRSEVGIDGAGTALAVWASVSAGMDVAVASRRALGGAFETPVPLSVPATSTTITPDVAVNASGEAAAVWRRTSAPSEGAIEARIGSTAASFEGLQLLASEASADEALSEPQVAIGPTGEAIAVWTRSVGAVTSLWYAVRPPGGVGFGSPEPLLENAFGPGVAIDPASGTAVIAVAHGPAGSVAASALARPPGGAPGPVVPLAPPAGPGGQTGIASVGFDASGAALVAWSRTLSAAVRLAEVSRRPAGGAFGPAVLIADMVTGSGLSVAAEPDGDAVAAWRAAPAPGAQVLRVGGLTFTPDPQAGGPGPGPGVAQRVCAGRRVTIVGTPRADRIRGTSRRDVIAALGGSDVVRGLGGADVVCGGAGGDTLIGGPGADLLRGEAGADLVRGGPGRDRMLGGAGRDRLVGGLGRDLLRGGPGRDAQAQ
jgi:hypothetical protein